MSFANNVRLLAKVTQTVPEPTRLWSPPRPSEDSLSYRSFISVTNDPINLLQTGLHPNLSETRCRHATPHKHLFT